MYVNQKLIKFIIKNAIKTAHGPFYSELGELCAPIVNIDKLDTVDAGIIERHGKHVRFDPTNDIVASIDKLFNTFINTCYHGVPGNIQFRRFSQDAGYDLTMEEIRTICSSDAVSTRWIDSLDGTQENLDIIIQFSYSLITDEIYNNIFSYINSDTVKNNFLPVFNKDVEPDILYYIDIQYQLLLNHDIDLRITDIVKLERLYSIITTYLDTYGK